MWNLLNATLPEGGRYVGLGEAALYALIGFAVVFLGIAFLVLIVWLVGLIIRRVPKMMKKKESAEPIPVETPSMMISEDVDDETLAVITAAITAYYQKAQVPCDFVIKKIKRNGRA